MGRPSRKCADARARVQAMEIPVRATINTHVTAILVLNGLPRLQTGSILAHELMHAWIHMNAVSGLPLQTEEGLCQLLAYLWIERQQTEVRTLRVNVTLM